MEVPVKQQPMKVLFVSVYPNLRVKRAQIVSGFKKKQKKQQQWIL